MDGRNGIENIERDMERGFAKIEEDIRAIDKQEGAMFILSSFFGFVVGEIGAQMFRIRPDKESLTPEHIVTGALLMLTPRRWTKSYTNMFRGAGFGLVAHDFGDTLIEFSSHGNNNFNILPSRYNPIDEVLKNVDLDKKIVLIKNERK